MDNRRFASRRRYAACLALAMILLASQTIAGMAQGDGHILRRIQDRGELLCGVNAVLAGFGAQNDAGDYVGFDTELCRAVAAAILGDANAVAFRSLTSAERPTALLGGEVDMISRNTTWTLSRDTEWSATFAPTTFYDGQGIMLKVDFGIGSLDELADESIAICANAGSTTELNISDLISSLDADWDLRTYVDADAVTDAYEAGACDAITSDMSGLVSRKATAADPAAHLILPDVISKEPLGPLSPQSDEQFADVIRWTVWGLITAEEHGISSANIDGFLDSDDARVRRLLGTGDSVAGDYLGINDEFMVDVITQVGNYAEIFARNLGPDTVFGLERGVNALWTDGGLLYAPPFR